MELEGSKIIDCSRCMYSLKVVAKSRTSFKRERVFLCWRNIKATLIVFNILKIESCPFK